MHKKQVREIAKEFDLHNAQKKDSTGICFIGKRPFREFLTKYVNRTQGNICTEEEKVIGEHIGLAFYTIGQRKGIGIGGLHNSSEKPWFVAKKDLHNNILYVVQGHDHPWLLRRNVSISDVTYTNSSYIQTENWHGSAKTRYRQTDAICQAMQLKASPTDIIFQENQWAVTAGQSLVLYKNDICLGGGIIT
jgi:tRNA-specific 2-thiouridylase